MSTCNMLNKVILLLGTMWTIWTLKLWFLATLKSQMPQHSFLVPVGFVTAWTFECTWHP
jgi:hypothetical protein